jgi:ribonuclease P protein component
MKNNTNQSISKKERKFKWKEAKKVIKNGKKGAYQNILIAYLPSQTWKFRINLTKNIKPAVRRNRIKRIIREIYRLSKPQFTHPFKVVFTVIEFEENIDFHEFKSKYIELLQNAQN